MISTITFTSKNVSNKILDDTLPKIACLIAIPGIIMLSYMFLVYWHGTHLFIMQMPFPMIVPFMGIVLAADYIMVENVTNEINRLQNRIKLRIFYV